MIETQHHCTELDERVNESIFNLEGTNKWIQCVEIKTEEAVLANYSTIKFCPHCGTSFIDQHQRWRSDNHD